MTFAEKLITQRKKSGVSQEELAAKLGVSRQAISRWESENTLPDTHNLKKLSDLFEVPIDYLLYDSCYQEHNIATANNIKNYNGKNILKISLLLIFVGAMGIIVLLILSTQIPSIKMKPLVVSDVEQINNNTPIETDVELYVPQKTYSFLSFLDYYKLDMIAILLISIIIVGLIMLVYFKKRIPEKKQ